MDKIEKTLSCQEAHPGLCHHSDEAYWSDICKAGASLTTLLVDDWKFVRAGATVL